ncbi:hypothetical protein QFC19_004764 [Naganishia cerealis]|uniref:Uncharacterized protein n=1 Tax=Naganishia cerealis TaxID=610337 RepID=A0ACC2VTA8_9TREE|nr:hypothetical protein QFC19_004764 [Naganishia cerealis]
MPPRRTTRQAAASTADTVSAPTPIPKAPARRTRASLPEPGEESADELDMEEPVKPVRRTRAPAKASTAASAPKETKVATGKRAAAKPSAKVKPTTESATKTRSTGRRKVKEAEPIEETTNDGEEGEEQDPLVADEAEENVKPGLRSVADQQETGNGTAAESESESEDEEDDEPTVRRASSSAQLPIESHQPPRSSRRIPIPIPIPVQTEDDALDALLSQSQHRSTHPRPQQHQRTSSQLSVPPQTPHALPRTIPQTPAAQTARTTRFVPGTAQGTAIKGKLSFPQTPGGVGRTPAPAGQSQSRGDGRDIKPVVSQASKKRLVIHKLVLVDFKSYAGRQEIGPFHKSFSAIVGPNGSGKSNTIDALLFVFGYRASKMRQGKLSELIHHSAGHERIESCSVEVWFREIVDTPGPDGYLLVPGSQLVVARTAYKNNSSKYSINDKTSSFTEVTTLLKTRGIDLDHKRFLILQGEVESIAQMKPKAQTEHEDGLLEYLEDIIGTSMYKQPIEDALVEVDNFNEARGEKITRLSIVAKEKSSLEARKREAETYLRAMNELTRKKSLLCQFHMGTLHTNIGITEKAMVSLKERLEGEEAKNKSTVEEIEELQKAYDEKLEAFEQVKHHVDELTKQAKQIEKEQVGLAEKKKHLAGKQKKLKKSIHDDGHARTEALSWVESHGEEIDKTRNQLDELEHKLVEDEADLEQVRDSLKDKTDEFTTQIELKQRELEPWTAKVSEKQGAIDVAQSEKSVLEARATAGQTAWKNAMEQLDALTEGMSAKRTEHARLTKEKAELDKKLALGQKNLSSMSANSDALRARVTASRQKTDEAKASLAANRSENAVLSTLTKLKDQGRIKGFHVSLHAVENHILERLTIFSCFQQGRLGDLGVIDDKYDVAVTTACGALNNLVVDTVEQGQACIEYLRRGNVGRASIMVLEKLPPRDLGRMETPENVPRLFDLIKPKEAKFAPAFYKAVMNTLVAHDLEQAQRIGYGKKRWRVVTLAGQLIDPSGTMSGGGARVQRGGMSSKFASEKVEPEVISRFEKETAEAEQELASFQGDRKAMEAEIAMLRQRIPEIEMSLAKLHMELGTGDKRIADAEKRVAELKSQSRPDASDEKRVKALDSEMLALEKEVTKLRSKASVIQEQIKDLQAKILEVGGVKLRAMQSKVANTKGMIDLAGEKIVKAEVAQAKAQRDAEKLEKTIANNTVALEQLLSEYEVVEADLASCQADLETITARVQEAQDGMEDVHETLAESKQELDDKLSYINAFRTLQVRRVFLIQLFKDARLTVPHQMDIKQKLEDNARIQKESKNKLKYWQARHDELELIQIDEEDEEDEDEEAEIQREKDEIPSHAGNDGTEPALVEEKAPSRKENVKSEPNELVEYSPDELQDVNKDVLNAEITQLEEEIGKAKPNLNVLAEWRKRESEYLERARDLEQVTISRDQAKQRYDELRKARLEGFMTGFNVISSKLKEMYQMITLGGNAELELVDSMDPFSEGIQFSVMPPKKSWKNISNLSGGEKTLSSLALVFALHVFKVKSPSSAAPF